MEKMNIGDAKHIFKDWASSLSPDNDLLIKTHKATNPEVGLSNNNYLHALFYTDYMFRHSQRTIRMLSGDEGDGFLSLLKSSFETALERIKKRAGFVQLILVDSEVSQFLSSLKTRYQDTLKIIPATTREGRPVSHMIICDEHMLREEQPHVRLDDKTDAGEVKAQVYFNSTVKTRLAIKSFDDIWKSLLETT